MIKFFRHIRKSLIEDNKMGKYFKYAIGEILLVVIGILIALQVNNWNTERKKQITQTNYLEEIKANLEDDLLEILRVREFNQVKAKSIETAFKIFNEHPDPIEYMPLFSNQMSPKLQTALNLRRSGRFLGHAQLYSLQNVKDKSFLFYLFAKK